MEYIVFTFAVAIILALILGQEVYNAKKRERNFIKNLYTQYGVLPPKKYNSDTMYHVDSYYKRHKAAGQIDDITWNDLELTQLWKLLNYTYSASGEEYLYYILRQTRRSENELLHQENIVSFFQEHENERVRIQCRMHELGYTGKYSLYDYLENLDYLDNRSNKKAYFCNLLFIALIALIPVNVSMALLALACLVIYNIMSYFRERNEIEPYIISFAYLSRLIAISKKITKIEVAPCTDEWKQMREYTDKLSFLQRGSVWMFMPRGTAGTGNPLELILDYLRMLFHIDLILFNIKLSRLREHVQDVDGLIGIIGQIESSIAIGAFRKAIGSYCIPEFYDNDLVMEDIYHPFLTDPVKNSMVVRQGVLLTGSNASGKSTFLKTVAVNAIMAQTIHTCTASAFKTSFFDIYSSMALRDDLQSGESYYIVEIKALKRILDAANEKNRKVLCFVDEVLRGTNTVERIAASTQILKALYNLGCICFAATHDIELTELLNGLYENFHFEESIQEGDILFPYRLLEGPASTRNAIKLLDVIGYDRRIIERSVEQADQFIKTGVWQMT
ncbi:MAG: hypothetical protein K6G30_04825 [Acetatifactor sp.]|nr:hypothetical protein [Acetatifactor sp.]